MTYDALRHFADSWGLVLMAVSFLTFIGWAFRPGSKDISSDAANSIFKEDDNG
jgi:cytochrome c oxidase cbb3-type subunit 4